jgi:hypothetical protein
MTLRSTPALERRPGRRVAQCVRLDVLRGERGQARRAVLACRETIR